MWFWVERVRFDAKIIDAVAAAAGGRGIFRGGCGFVAFAVRRYWRRLGDKHVAPEVMVITASYIAVITKIDTIQSKNH